MARRQPALQTPVDAFRLVHGAADGAPSGLALDRYGDYLVLHAVAELDAATVEAWALAAIDLLAPRGLVAKRRHADPRRSTSALFAGDPPPAALPIREGDAVLLCDLDDGLGTGLYLDLRDERFALREVAADREVLNLFAYTGAFSVHAALGGAARVTSVDSSRRALRRARANMSASGVDPERHRWFDDDVLAHLARARARADRYGVVVLDPPAFGRAGTRRMVLDRDFESMVAGAAELLAPGGVLVVATHSETIGTIRMRRAAQGLERLAERGPAPWDHPPAAGPREAYLRVLVARRGSA